MASHLQININTFDAIILGILFLSALIACFRGFIRELLSLGAWVGAAVITIYFFPHASELLRHYTKSENLAQGGGAVLIYLTALLLISLVNSIIIRYVKTGTEVGILDNLLGLIFGVLRGSFIVCFAYLILMQVVKQDPSQQPEWLKTSITKSYLRTGADMLVDIAPKYMTEMKGAVKTQVDHQENPQDYPPPDSSNDKPPFFGAR